MLLDNEVLTILTYVFNCRAAAFSFIINEILRYKMHYIVHIRTLYLNHIG